MTINWTQHEEGDWLGQHHRHHLLAASLWPQPDGQTDGVCYDGMMRVGVVRAPSLEQAKADAEAMLMDHLGDES
jgi:hypothetical protein